MGDEAATLPFLSAAILKNLLVEFIDGIAGVGVFELNFTPGNLTEDDAQPSDPNPVESFQKALQALDVAMPFC